jgi:hypothetical protein
LPHLAGSIRWLVVVALFSALLRWSELEAKKSFTTGISKK